MKKIIFCLAVLMGGSVMAACGGVSEDEFVAALNCSEGMSEYAVEGTPIQFCYDPAWGEILVQDAGASTGSNHYVNFSNSSAGPKIWYQSADYSSAEDGGAVLNFSFDDLNVYTDDEGVFASVKEQLAKIYTFSDENLNVRKSDVGGIRAARVHLNETLTYYVPNAWEGYHVTVIADYSMAEELDDFVYDMIL